MKPWWLILLLPVACTPDSGPKPRPADPAPTARESKPSDKTAGLSPEADLPEVPFKDLGWDGTRYTYKAPGAAAAIPFTGVTTDYFKSGGLKARYGVREGVYHGLVEEWYENGRQKTKTSYENGKHQGDNFYWNVDGSLQVHKVWKDDVLLQEISPRQP